MSDKHNFESCLEEGTEWEERVKPKLKEQIMALDVEQAGFDENPDQQLSGIDHVLTENTDINIGVKVRDNVRYRDDILVETLSVVEEEKDGWVYNDETDIIAYCWKNQSGTNLRDGILILLNDKFVQWFDAMSEQFRTVQCESHDGDRTWTSQSEIVKIDDIPDEFVYKEFNPELP